METVLVLMSDMLTVTHTTYFPELLVEAFKNQGFEAYHITSFLLNQAC